MIKNKKTSKIFGIALLSIFAIIAASVQVMAMCPLCTAASIAGVGVTRSLGWDDSIVGVFVGAMIVSTALWANNIFKKRNIGGNAHLRVISITIVTFVLTVLGFYYAGIFGPANTYRIFGMEKIIFGSISGAIVSFMAFFATNEMKRRNNGKVFFNYQSMIITFVALMLNVLIFWVIFK